MFSPLVRGVRRPAEAFSGVLNLSKRRIKSCRDGSQVSRAPSQPLRPASLRKTATAGLSNLFSTCDRPALGPSLRFVVLKLIPRPKTRITRSEQGVMAITPCSAGLSILGRPSRPSPTGQPAPGANEVLEALSKYQGPLFGPKVSSTSFMTRPLRNDASVNHSHPFRDSIVPSPSLARSPSLQSFAKLEAYLRNAIYLAN